MQQAQGYHLLMHAAPYGCKPLCLVATIVPDTGSITGRCISTSMILQKCRTCIYSLAILNPSESAAYWLSPLSATQVATAVELLLAIALKGIAACRPILHAHTASQPLHVFSKLDWTNTYVGGGFLWQLMHVKTSEHSNYIVRSTQ